MIRNYRPPNTDPTLKCPECGRLYFASERGCACTDYDEDIEDEDDPDFEAEEEDWYWWKMFAEPEMNQPRCRQ